jgi:hypothetical protein
MAIRRLLPETAPAVTDVAVTEVALATFDELLGGNPAGVTKTDANAKRDEFIRTVNGSDEAEEGGIRPVLLREFIDQKYLPFQRGKWKKSTQGTSENRIMHHVVRALGDTALKEFSLTSLQAFLESKADEGLSFSVVDHLRWDLSAIFEMASRKK